MLLYASKFYYISLEKYYMVNQFILFQLICFKRRHSLSLLFVQVSEYYKGKSRLKSKMEIDPATEVTDEAFKDLLMS